MAAGVPAVLAGDYNVVPTEAGHLPRAPREGERPAAPAEPVCVRAALDQGWTDALRLLQPEGPLWTFWAYLHQRWPNDKGMRLDHLLLSPDLATRLVDAGVSRDVRGRRARATTRPPG